MFLSSLNIYDVDDDDEDDDGDDDDDMMMTFSLFSSTSHLVSSFITTS